MRTVQRLFDTSVLGSAALVCCATFLLGIEPPASLAITWSVPASTPDIQTAIGLAASGDTIEVGPGTHTGPGNRNIDFGGKTLLLRSVEGAASTILDCQSSGRGLVFQSGESNDAVVQGFTITNGRAGQGGGVYFNGASPTLMDCVLKTNRADESGGGVFCVSGAAPRLIRCRFEGNTAFFSGGGASCINASPEIGDCVFIGNSAGILGGGIYCREASPTITRCQVEGNHSGGAGGGLVFYHLSAPLVNECTVTANRGTSNAGGAFCDDSASPTFTDCLVTGNDTGGSGGAIFCTSRSTATVRGSTISGNRAAQRGGGLYAEGSSSFTLERTILWDNCALTGDEAYSVDLPSRATFTCSDVDSFGVSGGTVTYAGANVFSDPRFCSPIDCGSAPIAGGNYGLDATSPCLPASSPCGTRIGAPGQVCSVTGVAVHSPRTEVFLRQNRPNPFNPITTLEIGLTASGHATLRIYDLNGRVVRTLYEGTSPAGARSIRWDGKDDRGADMPSGMYVAKLSALHSSRAIKMVLLR